MPNPDLDGELDEDYLLLDRARVLKRAMERWKNAGFKVRKLGDGRWDPRFSRGSWEMSQ